MAQLGVLYYCITFVMKGFLYEKFIKSHAFCQKNDIFSVENINSGQRLVSSIHVHAPIIV